jgi:hypothetical protein
LLGSGIDHIEKIPTAIRVDALLDLGFRSTGGGSI